MACILSKAHAYFERALAIARKQHARSWELRAAMSMARLWRDQGKRDEARELLAPIYGWFAHSDDRDHYQRRGIAPDLAGLPSAEAEESPLNWLFPKTDS